MIKIQKIDKEDHSVNQYFVIYNFNKGIHTVNGTPEEIIKNLYEMLRIKNDQ